MAKSNFIIRGGADFSAIKQEMQKTQKQMNAFQSSIGNNMNLIGKAFQIGLGYITARAIGGFIKDSIKWGSDVAEIQNVVDVTFGSMAKDVNEFSKSVMDNFGLSELAAKKYSSTMGAMLKSSGVAGQAVRDMSLDLTRLTADMASFHNMDNDEVFRKLMSGMSGMSMPLKELGINMNVANLEAFAMSEGMGKAYSKMNQAEQAMLRYNYLLAVTGDMQGDFSRNAHNWGHQLKILSEQWNMLKATLGQGFINILAPIIRGFNVLIKYIQVAAEYFRAFTALIFGNTQAGRKTATDLGYTADALESVGGGAGGADKNLGKAGKGLDKTGKAAKKAGKDMKGAIAGFDEINQLTQQMAKTDPSKTAGKGAGKGAGGPSISPVGPIDLGSVEVGEVDLGLGKIEEQFKKLKNMFRDFYENWGLKDIFKGIREGADLVNFDNIKENFRITFEGWSEISTTALHSLQPIFKAGGELLGTIFKYGIASVGNYFEAITLGFANFTTNMKGPIQSWIIETSKTITSGLNDLKGVFEIIGSSWLSSINKYKPSIAKEAEDTLANVSKTFMLVGTITVDTFKSITSKLKEFIKENKNSIEKFTDSIHKMFLDAWKLINKVWEDSLNSIQEFWDEWGKDIVSRTMEVVKDIGKWFLHLWEELVQPVWDEMMGWLSKIWNDSLKDILDELLGFVGRVGDLILMLWEKILKPLIDKLVKNFGPAFRDVFIFVVDVVGTYVDAIATIIKGLLKILNGIIDFVTGVFTGDWRRAWEGVQKIFKGVFDSLYGYVKIPINLIISAINTVIRGLNSLSIDIPDWVPGAAGGKKFGINIPNIPKLAKGGITSGPTMAIVGDNPGGKEVISPLDKLQDMLVSAVGTALLQTEQLNSSNREPIITKIILEGKEIAKAIYDPLKDEDNRRGTPIILPI